MPVFSKKLKLANMQLTIIGTQDKTLLWRVLERATHVHPRVSHEEYLVILMLYEQKKQPSRTSLSLDGFYQLKIYLPYLPVYKSTFYCLKIGPKNHPRLIHGSKSEIKKLSTSSNCTRVNTVNDKTCN